MGCAPTRIWRPGKTKECGTHICDTQYHSICVFVLKKKSSHSQLYFFICLFVFFLRLLQQVLFRIRDNPENQIIISTYK